METAVKIDGKINDPSVISKGWTVEIKFPWKGFRDLSTGHSIPPKAGDVWKLLLARYEAMSLNGKPTSVGWSWDPVGIPDNHNPEKFTEIEISDEII